MTAPDTLDLTSMRDISLEEFELIDDLTGNVIAIGRANMSLKRISFYLRRDQFAPDIVFQVSSIRQRHSGIRYRFDETLLYVGNTLHLHWGKKPSDR